MMVEILIFGFLLLVVILAVAIVIYLRRRKFSRFTISRENENSIHNVVNQYREDALYYSENFECQEKITQIESTQINHQENHKNFKLSSLLPGACVLLVGITVGLLMYGKK